MCKSAIDQMTQMNLMHYHISRCEGTQSQVYMRDKMASLLFDDNNNLRPLSKSEKMGLVIPMLSTPWSERVFWAQTLKERKDALGASNDDDDGRLPLPLSISPA